MLATCITISNLHKETTKNFSQLIRDFYNLKNGADMISKETYNIVQANAAVLDSAIIYDHNFHYN